MMIQEAYVDYCQNGQAQLPGGCTATVFNQYETEAIQAARKWMLRLEKDKRLNAVDKFNLRMAIPFLNSALDKIEDATV
jgi:hypothetical protein